MDTQIVTMQTQTKWRFDKAAGKFVKYTVVSELTDADREQIKILLANIEATNLISRGKIYRGQSEKNGFR